MKCLCGGELTVIHTEITSSNAVKRRRCCAGCGEKQTTYERSGGLTEHEQKLVEDFRKLPTTGRKALWATVRAFKSVT